MRGLTVSCQNGLQMSRCLSGDLKITRWSLKFLATADQTKSREKFHRIDVSITKWSTKQLGCVWLGQCHLRPDSVLHSRHSLTVCSLGLTSPSSSCCRRLLLYWPPLWANFLRKNWPRRPFSSWRQLSFPINKADTLKSNEYSTLIFGHFEALLL